MRILRELTELLRAHSPSIQATVDAIGCLDLLFGKAAFGVDFNCVIPSFSPDSDRKLVLREARHPLLEDVLRRQKKQVVPITLQLDETQRTLLISGPNTGGKTVAMKTAGLLALMAHAGLPVPAVEAVFPVFEQVLADARRPRRPARAGQPAKPDREQVDEADAEKEVWDGDADDAH